MTKPVFLIDMDGILANLHKKVARRLKVLAQTGQVITEADCRNNSPAKGFGHVTLGASSFAKEMLAEPGFYRDLEPIEGAEHAVEMIGRLGLRPVILSSLGDAPGCARDKAAWLNEHFKGLIHPRDYVFTSCKELVYGDFYIDDGAEYLRNWKARHLNGVTITLARPYTRAGDADYFAPDWPGAVDLLAERLRILSTMPDRR